MPKSFVAIAVLTLVTSAAWGAPNKEAAGEVSIGWDKGDQGRISAVGNAGSHGMVAPLDSQVFTAKESKDFTGGVQVALKLPKGSYDVECNVKHDPKAGEPVDLRFAVKGRRPGKSGKWEVFEPELEHTKGPLYKIRTTINALGAGIENKLVFGASKTMRFSSCTVVAEGSHPVTSAAPRRASHR